MLGKLMNSVALLSKNILDISDGGLRLWCIGGGLYILDSEFIQSLLFRT